MPATYRDERCIVTHDIVTVWTLCAARDSSLPEWARTVVVQAGEVFVAAAILGDEAATALHAVVDGETTLTHRARPYVRATWMRRAYPATTELLDLIELRIADAAAGRLEPRQGRCRGEVRGTDHV